MIKVNLAARKGATVAAASSDGTMTGSAFSAFSLGRLRDVRVNANSLASLKELPLKQILGVSIALIVASFLSSSFQAEELAKVGQQLDRLKTQQKGLKADLDKTKGFEVIKQSLDQDDLTMRTKIDVIQKLLADRQKPPKVLLGLSNIIPQNVWLSSFDLNATDVKLSGFALSQVEVPEFQRILSESADFKDVTLLGQSASADSSGVEVVKFDIQAKRK